MRSQGSETRCVFPYDSRKLTDCIIFLQINELWLDDMYFLNSIALPINSSPFYLLPKQQFRSSTDQLKLACRFIQFAHKFKQQIDG